MVDNPAPIHTLRGWRKIAGGLSSSLPRTPIFNTASFSLTLIMAVALALMAAVAIAPVAAMLLAAAHFRFPFSRIFDRTVMVLLLAVLIVFGRRLRLIDLLRQGFSIRRRDFALAIVGFGFASVAIALLFAISALACRNVQSSMVAATVLQYLPAAVLIGLVEEGFFRTLLLAGMERDFGSSAALLASSVAFAIVHIVRSPARLYLTGFHPMAGVENVGASAAQLANPGMGPMMLGLFLLGLVLGEAFLLTRRIYCSFGMHVGFVLGAKTWRRVASGAIPRWLAGPGPVPLIAAPAAWALSAIMLIILRFWFRQESS
jgi:membrane protease YdiL (CAAX protease family)